jgi:hypothetical protein
MREDLPAPGGPVTPIVRDRPAWGRTAAHSSNPCGVSFSIAVMARAIAAKSPASTRSKSATEFVS